MTRKRTMRAMERTTMRSLANLFLERRNVVPETKENLESTLRYFAEWWDDQRRAPKNLTFDDLEGYIYAPDGLRHDRRSRTGGTIAASTFNKKLSTLKSFVVWLERRRHIDDDTIVDAFDGASQTKYDTPKVRLSMVQIDDAVSGCADAWDRWVVAFAFLSLGRESEVLRVRLGDVDLTTGLVDWGRPKVKDFTDRLPMVGQLKDEYHLWRDHYLGLCPEITGGSFAIPGRRVAGRHRVARYDPDCSPTNVGHIVKDAAARALGVEPSTLVGQAAHIARRSGARVLFDQLRDNGVPDPIRVVQAMLGHKKQNTTEIYIGLEADRERRDLLLIDSDYMRFADTNVVQLREVK